MLFKLDQNISRVVSNVTHMVQINTAISNAIRLFFGTLYLICSLVSPSMSCEMRLRFVSFLALVALEGSRHHVRSCVISHFARLGAGKVALVTSERSFSCVLLHDVVFQLASLNARILAH